MIEKIKNLEVNINKENIETMQEFDDYEKLMLKEYFELMG